MEKHLCNILIIEIIFKNQLLSNNETHQNACVRKLWFYKMFELWSKCWNEIL